MPAESPQGPTAPVRDEQGSAREVSSLLNLRVSVPQFVVYRSFPSETVVLNLDTGRYHGLNATAGRMLEALERAATVADAASELARQLGEPIERIRADLCDLCEMLLERGLVSIDGPLVDPA